ncbi:MAG: TonB-dependent receptor [Sphingobacteriales bacterium]|nr:TonB-dependent receptor [Sphingobacteriales bacterium]
MNIEKSICASQSCRSLQVFTQLDDALVLAPSTFNGASEILYDGQLAAVYSTQNRDKANIYGISGSLAAGIGNYWVVSARAAYTYGDVVTDSLNTPLDHIAPLFGRVGIAYERPRWQADFYALFNGAKT